MSLRLLLCFAGGIGVGIMKPTSRNSLFGPENDLHLEVPLLMLVQRGPVILFS